MHIVKIVNVVNDVGILNYYPFVDKTSSRGKV